MTGTKPKTLPMLPFFPRDHLAATRHMTLAERGAYFDLLCIAWDSNEQLPKDPVRLARLVNCTSKEFKSIWPAIHKKLTETPDGYISERLEIERRKSLELRGKASAKAAAAADARWRAPSNARSNAPSNARSNAPSIKSSAPRDASSIAQAMLEECPPAPSPSPAPSKSPDSEAAASRTRARPADPKGQRARLDAAIDESNPDVQRKRLQARKIANGVLPT